MKLMANWPRGALVLLMVLVFITGGCISPDPATAEDNGSNQNLEILYLSSSRYFVPEAPGPEEVNKIELTTAKSLTFSHNIRDRKYNSKLTPYLNLWLDAHGKSGLNLSFQVGFQAWEEDTLITDKKFEILFENYTTKGFLVGEKVELQYQKYQGVPFDIKAGASNWSTIYLTINLTDTSLTSGKDEIGVDLYTGADGKASYIKIPYDQTLSAYKHKKDNEDDGSIPGFNTPTVIIALLATLTLIVYFRYFQKKYE
jgi:hypothetical protein